MAGSSKASKVVLWIIVAAGVGLAAWFIFGGSDDGDTTVPAPSTADRQAVSTELARATAAQRICYGWQLSDGSRTVGRGSNLGGNTAVDSDPQRCAKWVEVRATVWYQPESSESEDSATVEVAASPSIHLTTAVDEGLARFGVSERAFLDDPALAISRAALALPLLVAEAGTAEPAPSASVAPADAAQSIEPPGNDFWRDRRMFVWVAAGLLVVGGLLVFVGFRERRTQRAAPRP